MLILAKVWKWSTYHENSNPALNQFKPAVSHLLLLIHKQWTQLCQQRLKREFGTLIETNMTDIVLIGLIESIWVLDYNFLDMCSIFTLWLKLTFSFLHCNFVTSKLSIKLPINKKTKKLETSQDSKTCPVIKIR